MLVPRIMSAVRQTPTILRRNIGISAPSLQKASDPIQQLFVDKIREYSQKSSGGSKLLEPSPAIQRELKADLERCAKMFGQTEGVNMEEFPSLNFKEPALDPAKGEVSK